MKKYVTRIIASIICILAWNHPAFTDQSTAPRGEVRIVDQRPENRFTIDENRLEALVRYADDGELVPSLARSWRWVDDRTLDIEIHQDVKFQNGETLDAEIVKLNLELYMERRRFWEKPARASPCRTVDSDRHVPRYGDDLVVARDGSRSG